MQQVYGGPEWGYFKDILAKSPITFYGPAFVPRLESLHTSDQESYLLGISYGPLSLSGISFIGDPECRIFLDVASVQHMVTIMIDNALTAYDTEQGLTL